MKYRSHLIYLGCYEDEARAAAAADLARYLLYGVNPAKWPRQVGKPNFPPQAHVEVVRIDVLDRLNRAVLLDPDTLTLRLEEYIAVATSLDGLSYSV